MFQRKSIPGGHPRNDKENAQIDMLDKWYQQEIAWAAGYTEMLERHLLHLKHRCEKCPYRNQEGSGCNEKISD